MTPLSKQRTSSTLCVVTLLAFSLAFLASCYRQSTESAAPVEVSDAPAVMAQAEPVAADEENFALRILEVKCFEMREGERFGERVRNFFAYSLVDRDALDHYRRELGNPYRARDTEEFDAGDEDVFCEYGEAIGREFMIFADDRAVGLHSTDSRGVLRFPREGLELDASIVAVDQITGVRVVVSTPYETDQAAPTPIDVTPGATLDAVPRSGATDRRDRGGEAGQPIVVPPGDPFSGDRPEELPLGGDRE